MSRGIKRFKTVLIIGLCAAAAIAAWNHWHMNETTHMPGPLIEHAQPKQMSAKPKESKPKESKELVIQQEDLLSALTDACNPSFPVQGLSVSIEADTCVTVSGKISKTAVKQLLQKQTDSISSAYLAVADLLPEELPAQMNLQLRAREGEINVIPLRCCIASMEIPDSFVQKHLIPHIEQTIQRELKKQFDHIKSISSAKGSLRIIGT